MSADNSPAQNPDQNNNKPSQAPAPSRPPLAPGLEGSLEAVVLMEWTRAHYGSDFPAVFSTPAMIALMEGATSNALAPTLAEGTFNVGTRVEVDHVKAIPVGAPVSTWAKLAEIQGRTLIFEVEARSRGVVIGRGRIHQVIVSLARFQSIASSGAPPPQDRK